MLEPLPEFGVPFRSIAAMYLLHCLPGTMETKGRAFAHLGSRLARDGVLFGATILGARAQVSLPGRALVRLYNRSGVFGNADDTLLELERELARYFASHSIERHGAVALFTARDFRDPGSPAHHV